MKAHQRVSPVIIELAGLGPLRRAHRHDEFRRLLRCIQRGRVFAGKNAGAHAGADRAGAEQVDAQFRAHGLVGPGAHQRVEGGLRGRVGADRRSPCWRRPRSRTRRDRRRTLSAVDPCSG